MSFGRLIGQETEYAVRFSPERAHPGNERIYRFLVDAIGRDVETRRGLDWQKSQLFTQNGGAFQYEYFPYEREGGLVEGATPECRGPAQLLLYQRAQEALLLKAIPMAERWLAVGGYPGKLGLLKNCRDAEGHVYGAQESFETRLADGLPLLAYRIGLVALAPLLLATFAVSLLVGWLVFARHRYRWRHAGLIASPTTDEQRKLEVALYRALMVVSRPFVTVFLGWVKLWAFRRVRRGATAFVVSRPIWSGAGTVAPDGAFLLAEKAPAITCVLRGSAEASDRAIYDTGNLLKAALQSDEHPRLLAALFRRRQRLQLGLADSSMLEEAEFLKIGATALVIDMAESGYLDDAPRLSNAVSALHSIVSDPTLQATVETSRGAMTALEIQRYYVDKAKIYVAEARTASIEAREVVVLWNDVLTALEKREMERLVGRLDWVTKRFLLERSACQGDQALLKTIDLRYHELGDGYAKRFEATGCVHSLLSRDEIERAVREPPEDTPAYTRGRFIRSERSLCSRVAISWGSAVIGSGLRGKVIPFRDRGSEQAVDGEPESLAGTAFGELFRITTAGESHGPGYVVIVDGVPAGLTLSVDDLLPDLARRRPGQSRLTSTRDEADAPVILSGVFEGVTTGTPIAIEVRNRDHRPGDYDELRDTYRPGHADFTFDQKYGRRDHRGGGRSSARETTVRVAAGAIAKKLLRERYGVCIVGYVRQVGDVVVSGLIPEDITLDQVESNDVRCPDAEAAERMIALIDAVRREGDSIGGVAEIVATGVPAGWGEPVFDKLKADLAKSLFSLPAVVGVEYGEGFAMATLRGSEANDAFVPDRGRIVTRSNRHGGMLGGISSGMPIVLRCAVKPTSSLPRAQETVTRSGEPTTVRTRGRHDPCLLPRFVPMGEAMVALTLADHALRHQAGRPMDAPE